MQPPGHFSAVVSRNRTWKPQFSSFVENLNVRVQIISIFMQLLKKASKFSNSHTFRQNEKETYEFYKQEKGKRKVKNSAAVFVDVPVPAA